MSTIISNDEKILEILNALGKKRRKDVSEQWPGLLLIQARELLLHD
jgi:hypothetical protein